VFGLLVPTLAATILGVLGAVGIPRLRDWLAGELGSEALVQVLGALLPGAGAVLAVAWIIFSRARSVLQPLSERVLTYVRRPDYHDRMGYQHVVLDDLRFVVGRLRRCRDRPRVVVFIDDLDRCSDDKIMEILQAINLILGESEFFVFLGIDTAMIHRAIRRRGPGPVRPASMERHQRVALSLVLGSQRAWNPTCRPRR
jgi:KAP-like P-loop domain-containing protein